jgi:hypothetical protein
VTFDGYSQAFNLTTYSQTVTTLNVSVCMGVCYSNFTTASTWSVTPTIINNPMINFPLGIFTNGSNMIDARAVTYGQSNSISANLTVSQLAQSLIRGISGDGHLII